MIIILKPSQIISLNRILFQHYQSNEPLLTKGPLALFFGGDEIVPHLSSDSTTTANIPIFLWIALSVFLNVLLYLYKRIKFRKQIQYEQRLNQAMMTGYRNVYGKRIIFLAVLGFLILLIFHSYLAQQTEDRDNGTCFILILVLFGILLTHFIFNHKLRFLSVSFFS